MDIWIVSAVLLILYISVKFSHNLFCYKMWKVKESLDELHFPRIKYFTTIFLSKLSSFPGQLPTKTHPEKFGDVLEKLLIDRT